VGDAVLASVLEGGRGQGNKRDVEHESAQRLECGQLKSHIKRFALSVTSNPPYHENKRCVSNLSIQSNAHPISKSRTVSAWSCRAHLPPQTPTPTRSELSPIRFAFAFNEGEVLYMNVRGRPVKEECA
jgi:hypothetical protein